MATQTQVAEHLGISQQAVSKLVTSGVFTTSARGGLDLDRCRLAYLARLREEAAGRMGRTDEEEGLDLVAERARLAKEQADAIAMKNELMRGETIYIQDVIGPLGDSLSGIRNRLLALPSEHAAALHRCKTVPELHQRFSTIIHNVLTQLSEPERYADDARRASGGQPGRGNQSQEDGDAPGGSGGAEPGKRRAVAPRRGRRRDPEVRRDHGQDDPPGGL